MQKKYIKMCTKFNNFKQLVSELLMLIPYHECYKFLVKPLSLINKNQALWIFYRSSINKSGSYALKCQIPLKIIHKMRSHLKLAA